MFFDPQHKHCEKLSVAMKQNVSLRYINSHKHKYYEQVTTVITDLVFFIIIIILGDISKTTALML